MKNVYKPRGLTPLQVIEKVREQFPSLATEKMGYAGRLDPMAEGVLIILVGEECKTRKEYERLPKEYQFTVLFGIETDTYDTLGIIQDYKKPTIELSALKGQLETYAKKHIGRHIQEYPPFSSPEVKGKPLYKWAREGRIHEIEIPKKEIEIYSFNLNEVQEMNKVLLIDLVTHYISKVTGVFRQEEILEKWIAFFKEQEVESFLCATFTISCSSGTYMRSIAHALGKEFGWGAIAIQIKRTKVGEYTETNSLKL